MGGAQALKRIPRIKFPQRHSNPSGSASQSQSASITGDHALFLSSNPSTTLGGKASLQPKRKPVSNEEIEAILVRKASSLLCSFWELPHFSLLGCCLYFKLSTL
ncbi:hypothetical protein Ddye_002862 [Dipteronia dyeriana]|uniref:Uncharacterized protein n=1 Tax=Dipteronia dyeriana TaxID=168575 RepID=A0AAE0CVD9_9ROSI|nr:hypothetical protein Ddye_002862 [Dipteronia dyeriana]